MKKPAVYFNAFLLLLLLASSCSKDRIEEEQLNEYESLNEFFDQHKEKEQEFIITQDGDCPLVGKLGTRLCLGKGNLKLPNGDSVQYPFSIKLVELYTPKHIILYRMPNVSNSMLIGTGGEIRVRATKGSDELLLRKNHIYTAQMPTSNPVSNMEVYFGKDMGSYYNWTTDLSAVSPGLSVSGSVTIDSTNTFYNLQLPYLGWNSPNFSYSYPNGKTTISFTSETDDLTNVAKFLYYDAIPSVMQVYGSTSGQVPVGVPVKVICFAKDKQGDMFSFEQQVTVKSGETVEVTMSKTTESALLTMLENL